MNLHIYTEGQTFFHLRKVIYANFKRSTPCNLRFALGEERGEERIPGAKHLLSSSELSATTSSIC